MTSHASTALPIPLLLAEPERIRLVAQPVADLRRGTVAGFEVLSRFALDVPAPPDVVFHEAARLGLGAALEEVVLGRALALRREMPEESFIAINVDPAHLLVPSVLDRLLGERDLGGVVLELTEHGTVGDVPGLVRALEALRRHGAHIAVDDAGSGYNGLTRILALRPQFVKIDKGLVYGVADDDAKLTLVQMLGEIASRLDAWLVAEGVERDADLRALSRLGVPLAQGYFLARPAPPWSDLDPAARHALRDILVVLPQRARSIVDLLEPCALVRGAEAWPSDGVVALRVDGDGRPLAMRCSVGGHTFEREPHDLMRVKGESALETVVQRAVTRVERLRWDPLVCTDDDGNVRGVVPMARLVSAVAEARHGPEVLH